MTKWHLTKNCLSKPALSLLTTMMIWACPHPVTPFPAACTMSSCPSWPPYCHPSYSCCNTISDATKAPVTPHMAWKGWQQHHTQHKGDNYNTHSVMIATCNCNPMHHTCNNNTHKDCNHDIYGTSMATTTLYAAPAMSLLLACDSSQLESKSINQIRCRI